MQQIISAVFVNDTNQILALKRSPDKQDYPNMWDTVAGKIEENELPEIALRREIYEEIGISNFEVLRHFGRYTYKEKNVSFLVFLFLCKMRQGSPVINHERTEYRWFPLDELLNNPMLSPAFQNDLILLFEK